MVTSTAARFFLQQPSELAVASQARTTAPLSRMATGVPLILQASAKTDRESRAWSRTKAV